MLHKITIIALVIRNVKVISHEGFGSFIIRIRAWVLDPRNVNQTGHLVTMLVHGLDFVLNSKVVVLCKINYRNHHII